MQLIGLLKHETPVAYMAAKVPKVDELDTVPTVPLNSFEQLAIRHLRSDLEREVVIHSTTNQIQVVGALRAKKVCLACHAAHKDDLLGAFTYRFTLQDKLDHEKGTLEDWKLIFLDRVSQLRQAEEMPFSRGGAIRKATESIIYSRINATLFSRTDTNTGELAVQHHAIDDLELE